MFGCELSKLREDVWRRAWFLSEGGEVGRSHVIMSFTMSSFGSWRELYKEWRERVRERERERGREGEMERWREGERVE
jgi:hypothetical protein